MTTPTDTTDTNALAELRRVYLAIYAPEPDDDTDLSAIDGLTARQLADAIIGLHQALMKVQREYAQALTPAAAPAKVYAELANALGIR